MASTLTDIIAALELNSISKDRLPILKELIDYIQSGIDNTQSIRLNFICTHNSRRSHLAQIWAQLAAHYYNIPNVDCYSGGTEATALFPMIAQVLKNQGFEIQKLSFENNPIYAIKYSPDIMPMIVFSKKFDHSFNPTSHFVAIMTCDLADQNCPFVNGAEKRIAITYEDPKDYDNTPIQNEKYIERSLQIATEMFYVFSKIKTQ